MLLVCPKCSARYNLSSIALGEAGREVRCAKCEHEWYEEREGVAPEEPVEDAVVEDVPEDSSADVFDDSSIPPLEDAAVIEEEPAEIVEEAPVDSSLDEDPIPEGVRPQQDAAQEKENAPALPEEALRAPVPLQAKLMGYMAALMIFAVLIASGFLFKQQIVSAWQPAAAIYNLAGVSVTFKGEKLVMESLSATIQKDVDGRDFLLLKGRVINLTKDVQPVPKLLARLRSTNGEDGDSWHIDTPLKTLEAGESFTFKSDYPAVPHGVGSVNLTFVPTVAL